MTVTTRLIIAMVGGYVLMLAGCSSAPTRVERAYGVSSHFVTQSQILNPEAGATQVWVNDFDGQTAKKSLDRYHSTFEKPPRPPTFVISVGGIK